MGGILLKTTGRRIAHTPPPRLTSFTPVVGGFFFGVINDDGDGVYSTRRPLLVLLSPRMGGMSLI
jgi:hypothetical protein